MAIRAKLLGSKEAVKRAAARTGGGDFAQVLKAHGDSWRVRFLVEPEEWLEYFEHYHEGRYVLCDDEVCAACDDGARRSQRFLVPVLMVEDSKIACIKLPKTAYSSLEKRYQRYRGVLTDRDYEITRYGTGQNDTTYEIEAGEKISIDLSRFKPPKPHKDWEAYCFSFIQAMLDSAKAVEDEEDYEDETPKKPVNTKADTAVKRTTIRRTR